jgi:hypothetical protein
MMGGLQSARMMLPTEMEEEPVGTEHGYSNAEASQFPKRQIPIDPDCQTTPLLAHRSRTLHAQHARSG